MGTVIHDGYRLPTMGMLEARKFALRFCPLADEVALGLVARRMVEMITERIDDAAAAGCPLDTGALVGRTYSETLSAYWRAGRAPVASPDDLSCSVVFYPLADGSTLLARVLSWHDEYRTAWQTLPGVETYPYWNNVDRPGDVSRAMWKHRAAQWEEALEYGARGGFNVEIIGTYGLNAPGREMLLASMVPLERRIERIATALADKSAPRLADVSDQDERLRVLFHWRGTPEGLAAYDKALHEARAIIVPAAVEDVLKQVPLNV